MQTRGSTRLARERRRFILALGSADQTPQGSDITTPRQLRRRAAHLQKKIDQLLEEIAVLTRAADELEAARGRIGRPGGHSGEGLSERPPLSRVDSTVDMSDDHALAIAKGQAAKMKKAGKRLDPLTAAALAHGLSFRGLARKLDVGHGILGKYRVKTPIPRSLAKKIEKLIGFAATDANWPGGIKADA